MEEILIKCIKDEGEDCLCYRCQWDALVTIVAEQNREIREWKDRWKRLMAITDALFPEGKVR